MNKCNILWFVLRLQGVILDLKVLIFTWNLQISFFSLKEKVLVFKAFLLKRERERERDFNLRLILSSLEMASLTWRNPLKMKRVGVYLQRNAPHLYLRSNFDLDLPLGLYLGLNLIWLDLSLDDNFQVGVDLRFTIDLGVKPTYELGLTWELGRLASEIDLRVGLTCESDWLGSRFWLNSQLWLGSRLWLESQLSRFNLRIDFNVNLGSNVNVELELGLWCLMLNWN